MEDLWLKAKQVAQSRGRREDWVYIVGLYRSMGGKDMRVFLVNNGNKYEILGEADKDKILVLTCDGEETVVDRSLYVRSKKRFKKGGSA